MRDTIEDIRLGANIGERISEKMRQSCQPATLYAHTKPGNRSRGQIKPKITFSSDALARIRLTALQNTFNGLELGDDTKLYIRLGAQSYRWDFGCFRPPQVFRMRYCRQEFSHSLRY